MASLVLGSLSVWDSRQYYPAAEAHITLEAFYRLVIFRCLQPDAHSFHWSRFIYPVIATAINALSSLLLPGIYIYLCCKIRRVNRNLDNYQRQEIDRFRIRMTAISILNLVCWWPLCILHFVSLARRGVDPPFVYVEPFFIFLAAVSAANPIIYTIASRRFFSTARYACKNSFLCHRCNGERKHVLRLPGEIINTNRAYCTSCGLLPCPCPKKADVELYYSLTSGETGETSLFTDDV